MPHLAPHQPEHHDGARFRNPGKPFDKGLYELLKWQLTRRRQRWPTHVTNTAQPRFLTPQQGDQLAATWIGHATWVLQLGGQTLVTDPLLFERASPVPWAGPKRVRDPGASLAELPRVDAVLLSHNHFDHLDLPSVVALHRRDAPLFLVPLGNGKLLKKQGIDRVIELDWWQTTTLPGGAVTATLAPALHWSARSMTDHFAALWGSWLADDGLGRTVYFAGDTGYHSHFEQIRERLGPPSVALLPIGAYEPRWMMQYQHMNPDDAVRAHLDLGARVSLAMHHATFQLTDEAIDQPVRDLHAALERHAASSFLTPEVGETWRAPAG